MTLPAPNLARPTVALTMGDPGGIGAEIIVKALCDKDLRRRAKFHIYGAQPALEAAAAQAGIDPYWWRLEYGSHLIDTTNVHDVVVLDYLSAPSENRADSAGPVRQPTRAGGELSFRFVSDAITDARRRVGEPYHCDALVTAPISKQSWALAGQSRFPGHTELLATGFHAKRVAMMFHTTPLENLPSLNVVLASIHVPLMDVRNILTIGKVFDAIDLGHEGCTLLGIPNPRIAVCGLNPHAGEGGLLGDEETRIIEPAIRAAADQGIDARGPFPADTIFNAAIRGDYDLVVAMYHDQGLIPVKLLARDRAVNITLGLPTPRTSPDHGTAFDIAGQNKADPGSMKAAIEVAISLASRAALQAGHSAPAA